MQHRLNNQEQRCLSRIKISFQGDTSLEIEKKYLIIRRKYLIIKRKYLIIRKKYLIIRTKHLNIRRKYLLIWRKYLLKYLNNEKLLGWPSRTTNVKLVWFLWWNLNDFEKWKKFTIQFSGKITNRFLNNEKRLAQKIKSILFNYWRWWVRFLILLTLSGHVIFSFTG